MYPRMSLSSYDLEFSFLFIAENFDVVRYSVFKEQMWQWLDWHGTHKMLRILFRHGHSSNVLSCMNPLALSYASVRRARVFIQCVTLFIINVEIKGFEPLTPCLQGRCSPNWAIPPLIRRPPILPCRLQHSTFGRSGLNRRVRDENGCYPWSHHHRKSWVP